MKRVYKELPMTFEIDEYGDVLYRYNKQERKITTETDGITETTSEWCCDEIKVPQVATINEITEEVICCRWTRSEEIKLVNDYNAAQMGVYSDAKVAEVIERYKAFIAERDALKAQVERDCKKFAFK